MIDLAAIRERVEKASPGPWICEPDTDEPCAAFWMWRQTGERVGEQVPCEAIPHLDANASFIAHAREDVPLLLAEVERLRAEAASLWWAVHYEAEHGLTERDYGSPDCAICKEENPYRSSR